MSVRKGPAGEAVAIHGEATSYDPETAAVRRIVAVRIQDHRILASGHLTVDFPAGAESGAAVRRLLDFIGDRPLVGYYLDFTLALLDRLVQPVTGAPLPNPRVEVSGLYYDRQLKVPGKNAVDLRLDSIVRALGLPARPGADALSSAVASAMVYLRLNPPERE